MAILAISHVMKSTGYEHQNHKFRVFRQSLQVSVTLLFTGRGFCVPKEELAICLISANHDRNALSQYRVGLISYHDKPVIRDFWGQGLMIPQMTKMSTTSWRSQSMAAFLKKISKSPVSKK